MKKPFFMMLIGLPGAGKSEYAKTINIDNTVICSSDAMRKELFGDENIQDSPALVFEKLLERAKDNLSKGVNVIFDATNLTRKHRIHTIKQLPDCYKYATVVWSKYEVCIERDKQRERTVGSNVIKKMICQFQPPYYDEGWDVINVVITGEEYSNADYERWIDCPHDNPHHNNTVKEHLQLVATAMKKRSQPEVMIWVAKLHDIGKQFTKVFHNAKGEKSEIAHYYYHQNVGSYFALGLEFLADEDSDIRLFISWLINVHMDPFLNTKYYRNLPQKMKDIVDLFHGCDLEGA